MAQDGRINPAEVEVVITNAVAGLHEAKVALRSRIRAERRSRPTSSDVADAQALAEIVLELAEVQSAGCACLFASAGGEVGTEPLRKALARADVRVLLPIVLPGGVLDWAEDSGELAELPAQRTIGGPEPIGPRLGPEAVRQADVMLIPALAVDTLGRRLGQGVGYYDRALSLIDASVPVIALVHEEEVLDAAVEPIPTEPHDRPVHAVATPRRCLRVR